MANSEETAATRSDIHRVRNDMQVALGGVTERLSSLERTLARLEVISGQQLTPVQVGENQARLNSLENSILKLHTRIDEVVSDVEKVSTKIWFATGGIAVIAAVAPFVARVILGG